MTIQVFRRGQTVPIWSHNKAWGGALWSPSEGLNVTVTNPKDVVKVDDLAMDEDADGEFVYYYASASDDEKGWWTYECTGQDGVGGDARIVIKTGGFELQ